jgi:acyl-coenzyme A synthetase/AMP-(fatty) acid ligase
MSGYLNECVLTDERFRKSDQEWRSLMTGDMGRVEGDGRIYLTGRRDDVYKQNGFRISSLEIEGAALSLAGTRAAACLPASATHSAVLVVAADDDAMQIARALADLVGPERVPPRIRVCADLPLTANGKIDRKALAAIENGSSRHDQACL